MRVGGSSDAATLKEGILREVFDSDGEVMPHAVEHVMRVERAARVQRLQTSEL